MHRFVGTVLASALAQGLRFGVAAVAGSPPFYVGAVLLVLAAILVFGAIFAYTQHSSKYPKPYQFVT